MPNLNYQQTQPLNLVAGQGITLNADSSTGSVTIGTVIGGGSGVLDIGASSWFEDAPQASGMKLDSIKAIREFIRVGGKASGLPVNIAVSEAVLALCDIIEERTTQTCLYCGKEKMCNDGSESVDND